MTRNLGLAAVFVTVLAVSSQAQESGKRDRNTGGNGGDHEAWMLVNHGLEMLIDGSNMQLTAREIVSRAAAETGRAPGRQGASSIQQLQEEARQAMEDGNRMVENARNALHDRGRSSHEARICEAAEQFSMTLRTLASQNLTSPAQGQPARAANPNANQPGINPGQPAQAAAGNALSTADVASIALITEAVKEAIDACNLNHFTRHSGNGSSAAEQLQEHAGKMAKHSEQCLQRIESSLGPRTNPSNVPQTNPPRTGRDPAARQGNVPGGQPQTASVQTLAHQARELVQLIEEGKGSKNEAREHNDHSRK